MVSAAKTGETACPTAEVSSLQTLWGRNSKNAGGKDRQRHKTPIEYLPVTR
jgi:hypothetical protein